MIYALAEMYRGEHGFFNLLTYVTSRSVFAALTGMLIGMIAYPPFIRWQRAAALGERIRDDGPDSHHAKSGTPTMGGAVILLALVASALLWGDTGNPLLLIALAAVVMFAGIGMMDDWGKSRSAAHKGMTARRKIGLQSIAAALLLWLLWHYGGVSEQPGLLIPYWKDLSLQLGVIGFCIIGWLCIVGTSNAVNLTDGLDGLAILPAVIVAAGLGMLTYVAGHDVFAQYPRPAAGGGRGGAGDLFGRARRRELGVLVVQRRSGAGVHGRHRLARHRRRPCLRSGRDPPGAGLRDHGRAVRARSGLSHDSGRVIQADGPAGVPHGAAASSFRSEGLARETWWSCAFGSSPSSWSSRAWPP